MTVCSRRNGQTPRHVSQHVPAAFPSAGASRYIVLPHRKLACFHDRPTFRSLRSFFTSAAWDPRLCELSKNLITSFVYSHDLVSRLSLGTMRDVSRAAVWLCKAEAEGRPEGYSGVTRRALRHKMGFGSRDDPIWVRVLLPSLPSLILTRSPYTRSSCPSARPSRRTCPYTISIPPGAFCGPSATRTCRTLRRHPRTGVTTRWRRCVRTGRRMAIVCTRCSTWRRCSRRLFSPATWSGTSHTLLPFIPKGILTWGRVRVSSHMAHKYDHVIEELQ